MTNKAIRKSLNDMALTVDTSLWGIVSERQVAQ
jgi:hypothetical protein